MYVLVNQTEIAPPLQSLSLLEENRKLQGTKAKRYCCGIEKGHVLTRSLHQNRMKYLVLSPKLM
jgi:hypothetical protein